MTTKINGTNTAANPAITGADTDTGLSFGSDTVNINTGGTTKATVDSSGRVGIGTTSPSSMLDVLRSTDNATTSVITNNGTTGGNVLKLTSGGTGAGTKIFQVFKNNQSSETEVFQIDGGGNVGINDTSPTAELSVAATAPHIDLGVAGGGRMKIGFEGNNCFFGGTNAGAMFIFKQGVSDEGHPQASGSEVFRIDNDGDVGIGTTDPGNADSADGGLQIQPNHSNGAPQVAWKRASTGNTSYAAAFTNGSTGVGSISYTNGGTAFNTSSDYRLKENVVALSNGITRLKTLKPYRFNFKVDADKTVDGFLAHEVSSIVPEAITGEKDAVDSNDKPIYQGIDQAKLVPLLTAALQEAITKIETLETKVAALEAA